MNIQNHIYKDAVRFALPLVGVATTLCVLCVMSLAAVQPQQVKAEESRAPDMVSRIAKRLQVRLNKSGADVPPFAKLVGAIIQRQQLLTRSAEVTFIDTAGVSHTWNASVAAFPHWIAFESNKSSASFTLDADRMAHAVQYLAIPELVGPTDVTVNSVYEDKDVFRAEIDTVALEGQYIDVPTAVKAVHNALNNEQERVELALHNTPGSILNRSDADLGDLAFLGQGKSNFRGSTYARMRNVQKALGQHVNNVVVAPGETFSFNDTLGGPVTQGNGWHQAGVIVGGVIEDEVPGGGICQASTTVFRAMLDAGFVPVDRKSHSMYVSYYEQYGIGLDATIFPGVQDLTFVNDTEGHILLQAYTDGHDAYVNIYGTDDGRVVELDGPYFANNAPEHLTVNDRPLKKNEVVWVQNVSYADGTESSNVLVSRYFHLPWSIVQKHSEQVHAAAY